MAKIKSLDRVYEGACCAFCSSYSLSIKAYHNGICVCCDDCHCSGPTAESNIAAVLLWSERKGSTGSYEFVSQEEHISDTFGGSW
jgi:hypothetical protein